MVQKLNAILSELRSNSISYNRKRHGLYNKLVSFLLLLLSTL